MSELAEVFAVCPKCNSIVAKKSQCCDGVQTQPIYDDAILEIEKQPGEEVANG